VANRNGGRTRTQGVIELANPTEPAELTEEKAIQALELEKGTAYDWTSNYHWVELFDDDNLLATASERSWITDVERMLGQGGQPASVEAALCLPLRQANLSIETPEKDTGQAEFIRDAIYSSGQQEGMRPDLVQIVSQLTYAIAVKRTYHELVFARRGDGRIVYKSVAWRPPASCELIRDRQSGTLRGFRQYVDWRTQEFLGRRGRDVEQLGHEEREPGYVRIPARRAMVHINGQHRDPINGISDLSVTHWAWTLQQKIMLMWATFLDGQALPRVLVYGDSDKDAKANAKAVSTLRGSGVLGLQRGTSGQPDQKMFDILETTGKGAVQFQEMISYLDRQMSHSVLAGFLDLTSNASEGIGSYALSADQKGLFLTSRQAASKEIAATINDQLIAPLIRINFGADAPIPRLVFEKMSEDQTEKAIQLLQQLGSANNMHVPQGFIDLLIERVAQYLDLSDEKVEALLEEAAEQAREQAEMMGRPEEQSTTFNGQVTDKVNAAVQVLQQHKKEKQ